MKVDGDKRLGAAAAHTNAVRVRADVHLRAATHAVLRGARPPQLQRPYRTRRYSPQSWRHLTQHLHARGSRGHSWYR